MTWSTAPKCLRVDDASATVTYFGYAQIGSLDDAPVWRIMRLTISGTVTKIEFANGDTGYASVWDDRLGYTYS